MPLGHEAELNPGRHWINWEYWERVISIFSFMQGSPVLLELDKISRSSQSWSLMALPSAGDSHRPQTSKKLLSAALKS